MLCSSGPTNANYFLPGPIIIGVTRQSSQDGKQRREFLGPVGVCMRVCVFGFARMCVSVCVCVYKVETKSDNWMTNDQRRSLPAEKENN